MTLVEQIRKCTKKELLFLASIGNEHIEADIIGNGKHVGFKVHYNEHSLANIISMADLLCIPGVHIVFDSATNSGITVHMEGKPSIKFIRSGHGLYYFDHTNTDAHLLKLTKVNQICTGMDNLNLLQTVLV